jgi:hypothetical protein
VRRELPRASWEARSHEDGFLVDTAPFRPEDSRTPRETVDGNAAADPSATTCSRGTAMTLNDFYNEVSRHADVDTLKINAADTRRVVHVAFGILAKMDPVTLMTVLAKGMEKATPAPKKK